MDQTARRTAINRQTWKRGFSNGFKTSWYILRIMLPVYVLVTILGYTPLIPWLSALFEPIMVLTGLPGGAAIAFVTGSLVNIYAAMGIIIALKLSTFQLTIIALMLNICHELPVESAVLKAAGLNPWPLIFLRVVGAFFVGLGMNLAGVALGVL
jgi:hypothetical protein